MTLRAWIKRHCGTEYVLKFYIRTFFKLESMHRSSQFIKSTTFEQYNVLCTCIGLHNRTEMLKALHPFEHILDLHQSNPPKLKSSSFEQNIVLCARIGSHCARAKKKKKGRNKNDGLVVSA